MAQLTALALASALLILVSGLAPDFAGPAVSLIACIFIAAAMASKRSRETMTSLWRAQKYALAALFALCMVVLIEAHSASDGGWAGHRAAMHLTLFALAGVATGAVAAAQGRSQALSALIFGGVGASFIVVALGGRAETSLGVLPPGLDTPALTAEYGLLALLSSFLAADELRRRPSPGGRTLAPLSRRLFAPAAGLFASFALLFLAGASFALGALSIGLLAFGGAWAVRSRRSPTSKAVTPAIAMIAVASAAIAVMAGGAGGALPWLGENDAIAASRVASLRDALTIWREQPFLGHGPGAISLTGHFAQQTPSGARLLAETGLLGALTLLALCAALLAVMGMAKDRGRRMTRGFTLAAGALTFGVVMAALCPGFSSPSALLLSAMLAGLAASYMDEPAKKVTEADVGARNGAQA